MAKDLILSNRSNADAKGTTTVNHTKSIYLRERSALKEGNINEIKTQTYTEKSFMEIVTYNKNY